MIVYLLGLITSLGWGVSFFRSGNDDEYSYQGQKEDLLTSVACFAVAVFCLIKLVSRLLA